MQDGFAACHFVDGKFTNVIRAMTRTADRTDEIGDQARVTTGRNLIFPVMGNGFKMADFPPTKSRLRKQRVLG